MSRKARSQGVRLSRGVARRFFFSVTPPLVAASVLTVVLNDTAVESVIPWSLVAALRQRCGQWWHILGSPSAGDGSLFHGAGPGGDVGTCDLLGQWAADSGVSAVCISSSARSSRGATVAKRPAVHHPDGDPNLRRRRTRLESLSGYLSDAAAQGTSIAWSTSEFALGIMSALAVNSSLSFTDLRAVAEDLGRQPQRACSQARKCGLYLAARKTFCRAGTENRVSS